MTPFIATVTLFVVLLSMSAWGYFGSETPSMTALIPAGFAILLGLCAPGVKRENKVAAHIAVGLVALLTLALFMPLKGAIGRGDPVSIARVSIMLLSLIATLAVYVRSFIHARRARQA